MVIGRKQGIGILILGLLLLTGGILVLVVAPSWGSWIADYPAQAALVVEQQAPAQAAPIAQAILGFVLGPLIEQVGGYLQIAGYFAGSLLTLMALALTSVGMVLVTRRSAG
jgi:prepilin signal peptidase PulO-like enzyme (type II secretory pathway)